MSDYQLTALDTVIRTADGASIPNDPANRDRAEYDAWVSAGNTPDPHVPPAPAVPSSVTTRQARLALLEAGLLDTIENTMKGRNRADLISWQYASAFNRNDALIVNIAKTLGLTDAALDALFTRAAQL